MNETSVDLGVHGNVIEIPPRPVARSFTGLVVKALVHGTPRLARPFLRQRLRGVIIERNLAYREPTPVAGRPNDFHLLDIYRPADVEGPLPVVFYIHGGGFAVGSKDTHWIFGAEFARRGYLVVVPNYRLAPESPFPAGLEDVCAAWSWMVQQLPALGGDPDRVMIGGESAGANLSLGVFLSIAEARPEPFASPLHQLGLRPRALWLGCGFYRLQGLREDPRQSAFVRARVRNILGMYLGGVEIEPHTWDLIDPLRSFEQQRAWHGSIPPMFVSCGEADPVLSHSRALAELAGRRGADVHLATYPRAGHAFQSLVFTQTAKNCWADTDAFLEARQLTSHARR